MIIAPGAQPAHDRRHEHDLEVRPDVHAAARLKRREREQVLIGRQGRRIVQPARRPKQHEHRQHEDGDPQKRYRHESQHVVDYRVLPYRRDDADRYGDDQGHYDLEQPQLQRRAHPVPDLLHHVVPGLEGLPEVKLSEVPQVDPVLLQDGLVQAEVLAHELLGGVRVALVRALGLTGALSDDVVRVYPQQQEDKRGHKVDDQQVQEDSPQDILLQGQLFLCRSWRERRGGRLPAKMDDHHAVSGHRSPMKPFGQWLEVSIAHIACQGFALLVRTSYGRDAAMDWPPGGWSASSHTLDTSPTRI